MVLFNSENLEQNEQLLHEAAINAGFKGTIDEDARDYYEFLRDNDTPVTNFFGSKGQLDSASGMVAYEQEIEEAMTSLPEGDISSILPDNTSVNAEIYSNNILDLSRMDPNRNFEARKKVAKELAKLQNGDFAIRQQWDRWMHRNDQTLDPDQANELFIERGGQGRPFSKETSAYNVIQAADTQKKRNLLEQAQAELHSTGSMGLRRDALVLGSSLLGGVGPMEFAASAFLGWAIPEVAVASAARLGNLTLKMSKISRVSAMARKVRRAKAVNFVAEAAAGAAEGSGARAAASLLLKGKNSFKISEGFKVRTAKSLEGLASLRYNQLTWLEKTGLDALAYGVVDRQFINNAVRNSDELGIDLYTEKDAMIDTLMGFGLGVFAPGVIRRVGKALGVNPFELKARMVLDSERKVDAQEALGTLTKEEADKAREVIQTQKEELIGKDIFKQPNPVTKEWAEQLKQSNMSPEDYNAVMSYAINQYMAGNRVQVSEIGAALGIGNLFSTIDNATIKRLATESGETVFGAARVTEQLKNFWSVRIADDGGILGSRAVRALSKEEAYAIQDDLYRGLVNEDKEALARAKDRAGRLKVLYDDLERAHTTYREQFAANQEAKARARHEGRLDTHVYAIHPKNLINLREAFYNAYLKYKFGADAENFNARVKGEQSKASLRGSEYEPDSEVAAFSEEFEKFYNKYVVETPPKKEGHVTLYDFRGRKNGKDDKGILFFKFLGEMREAIQENDFLVNADDYLRIYGDEQLQKIIEKAQKFDVTEDTDLQKLFGQPRATREEVVEMQRTSHEWKKQYSLVRMDYNKALATTEDKAKFETMIRLSKVDEHIGSELANNREYINRTQKLIDEDFQSIKESIINNVRTDIDLQARMRSAVKGEESVRGISKAFRTVCTNALKEAGLQKLLGPDFGRVITRATTLFREAVEKDATILEAFLTPEDIRVVRDLPELEAAGKETMEAYLDVKGKYKVLMDPLMDGIASELYRNATQRYWDQLVNFNNFKKMEANPAIAHEVLIGQASQTVYAFDGSQRSVEHLKRGWGPYMNDIKNQLDSAKSKDGARTLLDVYYDSANKNDIAEALIRIKHGDIQGSENTDIDRIAQIISDQFATRSNQFKKYGSTATGDIDLIKRAKLKDAGKLISKELEDSYMESFYKSLSFIEEGPNSILAMLPTENVYKTPFTTKTGMSMYDDVLDDPYYAETKSRFPKVIYMTPDEYLQTVTTGFNQNRIKQGREITTVDELVQSRAGGSTEELRQAFDEGKDISMPSIEYWTREDGSIEMVSQEGVHRAIVAREKGIKKMPVAIFSSKDYREDISNDLLKENLEYLTEGYESITGKGDLEKLISSAPDTVKRGSSRVPINNDLRDEIAEKIKTFKEEIGYLTNIYDDNYRKMTVWALDNLDIDDIVDRSENLEIPAEVVLKAIKDGEYMDLINGDLQNFYDTVSTLTTIRRGLIGEDPTFTDGKYLVEPDGWIYSFRTGFGNPAAVIEHRQVASIDAFQNRIKFKNADAEIRSVKAFGFDHIDEALQHSYEKTLQSEYTLENFGSKPIAYARELVGTWNKYIKQDKEMAKKIDNLAIKRKSYDKDPASAIAKFSISPGALSNIEDNIALCCGLQNYAPSAITRVAKIIKTFLSASLLVKAGAKSLSDYSTIMEGFVTNGLVEGKGEAFALSARATRDLAANKDLMRYVLASTILQGDDLVRRMGNDPGSGLHSWHQLWAAKDKATLDWWENFAQRYANGVMNDIGKMASFTNNNKMVAALGIQMSIGNMKNTSYDKLGRWFQLSLLRESITKEDWDFLRVHAIKDMVELAQDANKTLVGESYDVFAPLSLGKLSDEVIIAELKKRGELNITPELVQRFRNNIISKAWNMVDASADEMISIPSTRITNLLKGGRPSSRWSTVAELATQYQSFGAALMYNTYGKRLANWCADEAGISIADLFFNTAKLEKAGRNQILFNLGAAMTNIALTMLLVESVVNVLTGRVQKPVDKKGNLHLETLQSAALGAMGTLGVVLDSIIACAQGGGMSIQMFPSGSNLVRTLYRVTKPLKTEDITSKDKAKALGASVINEVARYAGLKNTPIIGPVYNYIVGYHLDMISSGGPKNYRKYIKYLENKGFMMPQYQRRPQPLWERF